MKAYMVRSKRAIDPFGDHPGDCLIVNRRLSDLQAEVLRSQGVELVSVENPSRVADPGEHLVFDDHLLFTPELLREFVVRSRRLKTGTVCALKPGITTLRTVTATQDVKAFPDRVEYGLGYVPAEALRGSCQPVVIEPDRFFEYLPMPRHMVADGKYEIPLTERFIVTVNHWTNLWAAGVVSLLVEGGRLGVAPKTRLLGLALRARSFNRWKVLRQLNRVGRSCDIHPAAYVEGSTIGDDVRIGAGAVVRESVVGDGSYIGNNATVDLSVVGQNCFLTDGCTVQYCVLYPGAFVNARFLNATICGRDSFVAGNVAFTDFRFDGKTITVLKDGASVDTEARFLGACLGHGAYVGSGAIIAPGRTIANGCQIAVEKSRVISRCEPGDDVPGYLVVRKEAPSLRAQSPGESAR